MIRSHITQYVYVYYILICHETYYIAKNIMFMLLIFYISILNSKLSIGNLNFMVNHNFLLKSSIIGVINGRYYTYSYNSFWNQIHVPCMKCYFYSVHDALSCCHKDCLLWDKWGEQHFRGEAAVLCTTSSPHDRLGSTGHRMHSTRSSGGVYA